MKQEIRNAEGELVAERQVDPIYGVPQAPPVVLDAGPVRQGRYMHTSNGRKYWPLDPRPDEVFVDVVAHHLATRCRYNGAVQHPRITSRIFYSVAEHSVYVADYIAKVLGKPEFALEGLLHDGSESYNGDLIRPLKYSPEFTAPFKKVEELNELAVARKFGLVYPFPAEVKIADEAVTTAEVQQIVPKHPAEEWDSGRLHDDSQVAPIEIIMLDAYQAKILFLDKFKELWTARERARRDWAALTSTLMSA